MNLYAKEAAKLYSFLKNYTTITSDKVLSFLKTDHENWVRDKKNYHMILMKKQQKILELSSHKMGQF